LALVVTACSQGPAPAPEHVVVIVLDATHAAHLSCQGGPPGLTPTLDRLASTGTRFARAFAAAPWTLPSTASLMTGLAPERHGVLTPAQRLPDQATTLAEHFGAAGWRTGAFVQMVYASDAYGLDQGFADYRYYETGEKQEPLLVYDAGRWMEEHASERTLLYVHLRRPHSPYDPPRTAWQRLGGEPPSIDPDRFEMLQRADAQVHAVEDLQPGELEFITRLYRANLATADAMVDALLQRLPAPEDTLVVVLADHGEALGEHGSFGHGRTLWAEVLDIPLIVNGPGVRRLVSDVPASTLDVLPTLLEACGLPPSTAGGEGASLWPLLMHGELPEEHGPVTIMARSEEADPDVVAVVDGRWKLVRRKDGDVALYDRIADVGDRVRVESEHADVTARMEAHARSRIDERREAMQRTLPEPQLDEERLEQLEELGYLR
jgi:arylsulfatase A-like enzyme